MAEIKDELNTEYTSSDKKRNDIRIYSEENQKKRSASATALCKNIGGKVSLLFICITTMLSTANNQSFSLVPTCGAHLNT